MRVHEIKLENKFCIDVASECKSFEIRKNDRDYKVGDLVKFIPVQNINDAPEFILKRMMFEITYIVSGYGLADGYVAFAMKPVEIVRKGEK